METTESGQVAEPTGFVRSFGERIFESFWAPSHQISEIERKWGILGFKAMIVGYGLQLGAFLGELINPELEKVAGGIGATAVVAVFIAFSFHRKSIKDFEAVTKERDANEAVRRQMHFAITVNQGDAIKYRLISCMDRVSAGVSEGVPQEVGDLAIVWCHETMPEAVRQSGRPLLVEQYFDEQRRSEIGIIDDVSGLPADDLEIQVDARLQHARRSAGIDVKQSQIEETIRRMASGA